MARRFLFPQLNGEQKCKVCLYLSAGCDREAAAKLTGCSSWEVYCAMLDDATFAAEVRSAEGASELAHIRNIQNAALDVKNWRASIWWLERRSPERFGKRAAGTITTRHLKAFVVHLLTIVSAELSDPQTQEKLFIRLEELVTSLDQLMLQSDFTPSGAEGETNARESSVDDATDLDDEYA